MVGDKPAIGLIIVSLCFVGLNANTPASSSFTEPTTQRLAVQDQPALLFPVQNNTVVFDDRMREAKIEETQPQLKEHNVSKILSDSELISVLQEAGFDGYGLKMAWAIVQKESSARPFAHNDNASTGDNSYGLFQINMLGAMGPDRRERFGLSSNNDLFDPLTNASVAFEMSSGGKAWGAWTTYEKAQELAKSFPG